MASGENQPEGTRQMNYAAEVRWATDGPSTSQVEYGEDPAKYANLTPLDNNLVTDHRVLLRGLKPSVKYHYRVRSRDQSGEETISEDFAISIAGPGDKQKIRISGVETRNIIATGYEPLKTATEPAGKTAKPAPVHEAKAEKKPESSMIMTEAPVQEALIQQNALLLPPGKFQIEPSLVYAHSSSNKITVRGFSILPILVIGQISTEKVKRDIFIPTFTVRGGIMKDLQAEFRLPYRQQLERVTNDFNVQDQTRNTSGIGDMEGSLYYQCFYERGPLPGLIAGATVKSDSGKSPYGRQIGLGTGHWAVKGNLTAVKSSDPAILFAGAYYTWNFGRDISGFGYVDPGDTIGYNLGVALALNYQTALNFQFEQAITNSVVMSGTDVPGSFVNVADVKVGLIYSISRNCSVDLTAGIGLTEDSPDFTAEVRVPYTF